VLCEPKEEEVVALMDSLAAICAKDAPNDISSVALNCLLQPPTKSPLPPAWAAAQSLAEKSAKTFSSSAADGGEHRKKKKGLKRKHQSSGAKMPHSKDSDSVNGSSPSMKSKTIKTEEEEEPDETNAADEAEIGESQSGSMSKNAGSYFPFAKPDIVVSIFLTFLIYTVSVLRIRIRKNLKLFDGSESEKKIRIRIQL
jgi:cobalamin biosynthesis Mg chelatase CobN